ncbi:unnamed protein product [Kuraishia capsulata CBS 1993]|uniref:Thioesterase domain-containing protein n=1 Tax=Kuraishia capsulata CBS 1993 TaxID=1382522 RepID=W6MLU3_9ASCO|nr:uncharacterized protein KUCA_T00001812001 [Kuraishia capsulata CBS 1993]CDK25842.1 unnamed protein product [Kuraishia capsulata CBS 1993]
MESSHESIILQHPYAAQLMDAASGFHRVGSKLHTEEHKNAALLTGATLSGPGMIGEAPVVFSQYEGDPRAPDMDHNELVCFYHLGSRLCGHPGLIHGGLLATLLDESLCRCAFPLFASGLGVTARLELDYLRPTPADGYVVLKAQVLSKQGRKIRVKGVIESFEGEELVQATILVVEPRWAGTLASQDPKTTT